MRRALGLVGIAALVVLVMAMPVGAQQKWVRGTVITMAGDTITVRVGPQDMTFTVDASTTVIGTGAGVADTKARQMGRGPKLSDVVKTGEAVEVHYVEKGTANYATTIRRGVVPTEVKAESSGRSALGVVKDVTGSSLTVTADGKDMTFTVDSSTRALGTGAGTLTRQKQAEGQKPVLADFVGKGDDVIVNYREKGGAMIASEVRIMRKAVK
jgi:ribosome maturation factor RimP